MLNESEGLRTARRRIAREREERTGFLDLGELGLQSWPEELWGLAHLTELNLSWGWYDEKGEWHRVKSGLPANRAAPGNMRWAGFPNLGRLHISELAWTDLEPLRELASLRFLDCSLNGLTTLEPLAGLTSLESLQCSRNMLASLKGVEGLISLKSLDCSENHLTMLEPLAGLTALGSLECFNNRITTLEPLAGLAALRFLYCWDNQLTALKGLEGVFSLQSLDCSFNRITTLESLGEPVSLQSISLWGNPVGKLPEKLIRLESLGTLVIPGTALDGIPAQVSSRDISDNCLERLRAWLRERWIPEA